MTPEQHNALRATTSHANGLLLVLSSAKQRAIDFPTDVNIEKHFQAHTKYANFDPVQYYFSILNGVIKVKTPRDRSKRG